MGSPRYVSDVSISTLVVSDDGRSHPFPVHQVPELLRTRWYFVERFTERFFLRSLNNPYFLREVNFAEVQVELDDLDADPETGMRGTRVVDLTLMWVQFTAEPMTVGYEFEREVRWFVPVIDAQASISDCDEEMQTFYDSVDWEQAEAAKGTIQLTQVLAHRNG